MCDSEQVCNLKRTLFPITLVLVSAALAGCAFEQTTTPTAPSDVPVGTPTVIGPPSTGASMLGTWSSNLLPAMPGPSTCGNFQYQITGQTANSLSGTCWRAGGALGLPARPGRPCQA